jgi:hypothetical protein
MRLIACHFPRRVLAATNSCGAAHAKFFPASFPRSGHAAALVRLASPARKKTTMDSFIGFAEVAGAIIAALGLALGLEWAGLYGLTSLMPVRRRDSRDGQKS